ncbi:MAG: hypothetical protein ACJ766_13270 [Thermoleophilaceae bacterium]
MAAVGRHEYTAATAALAVIACLWLAPLFTGDQLGQSYMLRFDTPWKASPASRPLPLRSVAPDAAWVFHPLSVVARKQLEDGRLPLWNPYEYGGLTLVGNMQSALFFPLTWPLLLLPFGYAWGAVCLAKLVLASVGAYALARELRASPAGALVAGTVYMLSAPLTAWLQWPLAAVFALFPWLLLATTRLHRRRTLGSVATTALAVALTVLAGHPESALISISAAAVYLLVLVVAGLDRAELRVLAAWAGGLALGLVAAGFAIVPFAQALHGSESSLSGTGLSSIHPPVVTVLQWLVPNLFGTGEPDVYNASFFTSVSGYFGLPALMLAVVALWHHRRSPPAIALAIMALFAALASYRVPPVSWFVGHVFPWSRTIIGERAYFVVALAGAVGAGAGVTAVARRPLPLRRVALVVAGFALAVGLGFAIAQLAGALDAPADVKRRSLLLAAGALLGGGLVLAALGRLRTLLAAGLALIVAVLSLGSLRDFNVTLPPDDAYPPRPAAVAALEREPGSFRVGVIRRGEAEGVMPANTLALYGLEGTEGYDFPLSRRWSDFQTLALGYRGLRPERRFAVGPPRGPELTALRMMNTRFYLAAPGTRAPAPGFRAVYRGLDATVFRDPGALPRAYVVPATRSLPYVDALTAVARGRLDPRREALVPPGSARPPAGGRFRPAVVERLAPDHVRVRLARGSAGWLVLANAWSPAWKAEVDGHATEVRPTDFAAMGIPVGASTRTVDFRLSRTSVWLGIALGCAGLLGIAALAVLGRIRS